MTYVECWYVAPILEIYNGGQKPSDKARDLIARAYTLECMGFDPEDYAVALMRFVREYDNRTFRPSPAELRNCLIAVHSEKPSAVLERVMWAHYHQPDPTERRQVWDPAVHGPKPSRPGCRISQQSQDRIWRQILDFHRSSRGYLVRVRYGDAFSNGCVHYMRCPSGFALLALTNRCSPDIIDPRDPECPIPRHILREYEIPVTDRDIAAGKAEFVERVNAARRKMLDDHREHLEEMQRRAGAPREPAPPPEEPKPTCAFVGDINRELLEELSRPY
jgi:hypothetical protein